jgi:nondiscriminating aspartyl-tRNA synthetase
MNSIHRVKRISIHQMKYYINEQVLVRGWVHSIRQQKTVHFITLRDGYAMGQLVVIKPRLLAKTLDLPSQSAIEAYGIVVENSQAAGGYEIQLEALKIHSQAQELPIEISKKEVQVHQDTFLDHAALMLRRPEHRFVHRVAALIRSLFRQFMEAEGCVEINSPKLSSASVEGGADVFTLDYFGSQASLVQSPQLYKQIMVGVFERVYEIGPVFRAEQHNTSRHLNEYISMDAEFGFIESTDELMEIVSRLLQFLIKRSYELIDEWPEKFSIEWPQIPQKIPVMSYDEALRVSGAEDELNPQSEKKLGEWALGEFHSDAVFIYGYPLKKRPFYTAENSDKEGVSLSFDLLFRGQEIVTGGMRKHSYEEYKDQPVPQGYKEAFQAGMPSHGGFGLGLERLVQSLFGFSNIRQAALFPRDGRRLSP